MDSFPRPMIATLVDSIVEQELISFLDVYFRYNQIFMHLVHEENFIFMIEKEIYCYKVMPLGLKNVGTTYQQLVNKMFRE